MAAPQLRLEVSLNLAGFRGEIRKLTNIAQSEFAPKINVKFNRQTLDTELNNLQAAIKRRVYRIEIGGNIDTLPNQIRDLKKELASLESFKIDLGIGAVKSLSKRDASKIKSDLRTEILGQQKKIYVGVSIKPSITRQDVRDFKNAVQSQLTGLSVKVKADLEAASISSGAKSRSDIDADVRRGLEAISEIGAQRMAGGTGGVTEPARREQLKQSLSQGGFDIAALKEIGKQLGVAGVGRFKNANSLINKIVTDASIEMVKKYLDPQAVMRNPDRSGLGKVLDTFARGIFNMLGMDPASIRAQQQASKPKPFTPAGLLPAAYRGIGPSAEPAGLLPPAYRGIGPSRNAGALPGSSFASQKLLTGDLLTPSMKGVIRDAANDFIDGIRQRMNNAIRQVNVEDLGRVGQRTISGSRVAGYLPPVARFGEGRVPSPYSTGRLGREGETRAELFARREREARMRSALRGVDVMGEGGMAGRTASPYAYANRPAMPRRPTSAIVPYEAGGALVPSGGGGGTPPLPPPPPRGGGGGGGAFGGMQFNIPQLPGTGLVREVGEEFGFAAKQVLLYGTAYKALGLLQTFPAQVGEAVGALQSFRNTIGEISPSAKEAADSSQFILDIVDKYNTPLQSARDGFVKLYASMQPAGFSGDEIRDLFLGISQTAATFGMSADKVDRVNYAFAQMASKGQVMSEELKGQLGDVLPGAMAIFAEAAGFKGPEAITKFSKALEDGAYKGGAMKVLLTNVGSIMRKEFGPGAEGAARTFQGVMNRMQNSLKLLYETFEPVAVGFLNSVVMPMTSGLKTVTDGLNAFFTGAATKTSGGFAIAQELEKLRPTFDGIRQNAVQLIPIFGQVAQVILGVGKAFLQIASNPFVGYVARVYLNILALTTAINILNLRALIPFIANLARSAFALIAFSAQMILAKQRTQLFGLMVQTAGMTLRTFFASTGVGLVLVGIGLLIERFMSMNQALADTKAKALGAADAIRNMSQTEARQAANQAAHDVKILQALQQKKNKGEAFVAVTKEEQAALARAGITTEKKQLGGGTLVETVLGLTPEARTPSELLNRGQESVDVTQIKGALLQREGTAALANRQITDLRFQEQQTQQAANIAPIPPGTGEDEANKKKTSLESYYSLQDQLAKAQTQAAIERMEAEFEHLRAMVNAEYDLKEAKANSFQKKAIAFQKEIFAITSEQDAALFKNRTKILAAAGSVAGGAGAAMGGVVATTGGALSQDALTRGRSSGAHLHAQAAGITEKTLRYLVDKYLEVGGKTASAFGQSRGSAGHGYNAIDFLTPQGTPIKLKPGASMSQYGPAGGNGGLMSQVTTPEGNFQLGHLSSLLSGGQVGAGAPGKVAGSVKRDKLADQQVALTAREASAAAVEKEAEAIAKLEIATANYVQSLVPTAEQALQNQLLQQRITLTQNSFSPEILEAQLAFAEQELQVAENITKNTEEINRLTAASGNNTKQINALTDANNQLKANLPVSAIQLLTKAIDDQVLSLVQRTKTAKQDAADQERVNSLIIGGMTRQAAEAKVTAENLRSDYKKALEEATRQVEIAAAAEEVLAAARRLGKKETAEQTAEYNRLAKALKDAKDKKDALEGRAPQVEGAATGVEGSAAPKTTSGYIADGLSAAQEKLDQLTNTGYQVVQAANAIGEAFGTAFKGVITGSMTAREALAGMFQSVADHFADMVAQMIAEYLKMALIKGIMSIIGGAAGALGGGLSSGFNAGTSSAIDTGATGWANSFATPLKFANGGITPGGFTAFANGGVVTGPTLGLVGEGRYNEAVIPLPDGKSVPVQLSGGDGGNQVNTNITVNVSNGQAQSNATGSNSSELGRKLEGAVKQVIVGELRPGGLLASR